MKKIQKKMILELAETFDEAHKSVEIMLKNNNIESAEMLLVNCQKTAVHIIEIIEKSESNTCPAIAVFKEYCSAVFNSFKDITSGTSDINFKELNLKLNNVKKSIKDIKVKREVAFFPYKAAMWDSLESIWKSASLDPDCDVYVVPIPYYDRNPDHSLGKFHYEGNEYPDYVPVTDYRKYDYKARRPDIVYIHNPYDDCNYVTTVDKQYYSRCLKPYVDCLVYVPYFVLNDISPNNKHAVKSIEHFCLSPGVINADKVIVQSEDMRQVYINVLLKQYGNTPENKKILENKILGLGSPKFDKVAETNIENINIPDEWKKLIYKPDGTKKKVILYNTGISELLKNKEKWLKKILMVFDVFKKKTDDAVLLWRPHPLIRSTISSMLPMFSEIYDNIVENYVSEGWGIYDDTSDLNRAIILSDKYYGNWSSVVWLYKRTGKDIMIQWFQNNNFSEDIQLSTNKIIFDENNNFIFPAVEYNALYSYNLNTNESSVIWYDTKKSKSTSYVSGTVYKNQMLFAPFHFDKILIYNAESKTAKYIDLEKRYEKPNHLFWDTVTYKNYTFLIPGTYNAIVKYDWTNNTVEYYDKWIETLTSCTGNSYYQYFKRGFALIGNMLYLAVFESNNILKINLNTMKYELFELNIKNIGFNSICGDGKYCYISGNEGSIIVYDPASKNIRIVPPLPETGICGEIPYEKLLYHNNHIYTVPRDSNKIMVMSTKNFTCKCIDFMKGQYINAAAALCGEINNNKLYLYLRGSDSFWEIDLNNYEKKEFIIYTDNKDNNDDITKLENCYSTYTDNYIELFYNQLEQFVDLDNNEKKRIAPDFSYGQKIWEETNVY